MKAINSTVNKELKLAKLGTKIDVPLNSALHYSRFFSFKQRVHRSKNDERQTLILVFANLHRIYMKNTNIPLGFRTFYFPLTALRNMAYDFKEAFDVFFEVVQEGYNLHDGSKKQLSLIRPRILPSSIQKSIDDLQPKASDFTYIPPDKPNNCEFISKVMIDKSCKAEVFSWLEEKGLSYLQPEVQYLFDQPDNIIEIFYEDAGAIGARQKSVYPIVCIENWPKWLRQKLFGNGVDVDSALLQFQFYSVEKQMEPRAFNLLFRHLEKCFTDKKEWRENICRDIGLEVNETNIKNVKEMLNALANGSNITGQILVDGYSHSTLAQSIRESYPEKTDSEFKMMGDKLHSIAVTLRSLRRKMCIHHFNTSDRQTMKHVFKLYFEWEREVRHKIWKAADCWGLFVHDGLDGIPSNKIKSVISSLRNEGYLVSES